MEDAYVEQLIKKKKDVSQMGLRAVTITASVFLIYILMVIIGIIALIGAFCLGYLIYYVFQMTSVEYEYIFCKGDLTIDAIYGGNKRKNVGKFDLTKCELVAIAKSTYAAGYHRNTKMKTFNFTSGEITDDSYIIIVGYGAGNAKIYFEPNETMIQAIKTFVPNKIKTY